MEMPTCALIGHAVQLSLWERLVLAFRLVWGGWLYTAIHLEFHPDEEEVVSSSAPVPLRRDREADRSRHRSAPCRTPAGPGALTAGHHGFKLLLTASPVVSIVHLTT